MLWARLRPLCFFSAVELASVVRSRVVQSQSKGNLGYVVLYCASVDIGPNDQSNWPTNSEKAGYPSGAAARSLLAAVLAQCLSNHAIASQLTLSERTVERHVATILNQQGFITRTQIATWAVMRGLDQPIG